jgi:PLP dependent protein
MSIESNITRISERLAQAARRAGRKPDGIVLMAVSKTVEPERIRQAYNAGLRTFGENRVQEFVEKTPALNDLPGIDWHLIGHLQSNKAKRAAELFHRVDSVDSVRLAQRLEAAAQQMGKVLPVLIEINVGGEESKSGIAEGSPELEALLQEAQKCEHVQVHGLMTIPPYTDDPDGARPYFRKLRNLRNAIDARRLPGVRMDVLSMGMSHDFEVAVEEGSTCVRVGTAIFGGRPLVQ